MSLLSRLLLRHIKIYRLHEFDPEILSTQIDDGIWYTNDNMSMNIKHLEDNLMPEFKENLERYPINIFMENEANYNELLDSFEEIFQEKVENETIAEYYSEICLNIPVIYFMLGRMKDIDESWDRI